MGVVDSTITTYGWAVLPSAVNDKPTPTSRMSSASAVVVSGSVTQLLPKPSFTRNRWPSGSLDTTSGIDGLS